MLKKTTKACLPVILIILILLEGACAVENGSEVLNSSEILEASVRVTSFMEKNQRLPETITVRNSTLDPASYTYALSRALTGSATVKVSSPGTPPLNIRRISGTFTRSKCLEIASKLRDFTATHNRCPSTISYNGGTVDFYNTVYLLSKTGAWKYSKGGMPGKVNIKTPIPRVAYRLDSNTVDLRIKSITLKLKRTRKVMDATLRKMKLTGNRNTLLRLQARYRSLNSTFTSLQKQLRYYRDLKNSPWYVPASLRVYLKTTAHCSVTDPNIVYLARELSENTTYATGDSIFRWVRDSIDYSFYYRTRYGATGTLKYRTGNCVDQAHLLVALARTSGIPARYVRGYCKFISGNWYSHVWVQIWIRGRGWVTADTTHTINTLGCVRNWDRNASKVKETLREYSL